MELCNFFAAFLTSTIESEKGSSFIISQYFLLSCRLRQRILKLHSTAAPWPWGGKCHLWAIGYQLFATPGNFFAILYCCYTFVAQERSPEILFELKFGLHAKLESSSCNHTRKKVFLHTHFPFECGNKKYTISQILCHMIPPGHFFHLWNKGLATGLAQQVSQKTRSRVNGRPKSTVLELVSCKCKGELFCNRTFVEPYSM